MSGPISCLLDAIRALGYVGQQQRLSISQEPGARLLKDGTRSDATSGSARGRRMSRSLSRKLWQLAKEQVSVKHGTDEYRVMATIAFWIGSFFIIGSLLFTVGAAASMASDLFFEGGIEHWQSTGLITYTYLTGGTYFTVGAYLGFFHVINDGHGYEHEGHGFGKLRLWSAPPASADGHGNIAYWGSLTYFVGAVLFQMAVIYPIVEQESWGPDAPFWLEVLPTFVGACCFTIAGSLEFYHNRHAGPKDREWWLVVTYLLGCVLFCSAASVGFLKHVGLGSLVTATGLDHEGQSLWLVDCPYAIGSLSFWVGSWVQLRMWKAEQHGLGFMSEMNAVLSKMARPLHFGDQLMLMLATVLATLTVLNLGLSHAYNAEFYEPTHTNSSMVAHFLDADDLLGSMTACVIAHAILLLETVLHATPSIHPYDFLIGLMRIVTLLLIVQETLTSIRILAVDV